MLPNRLLVKRGKVILAELKNCRPGGEMFWIACNCHSRPGFAEVASIFRQMEAIPYSNQKQVDKQLHKLFQQLVNMGVILENPVSGDQWMHFLLSFIDEDVVEVRYEKDRNLMKKPVVIILAGGANSRFWPLREKSLYRFMDEPLLTKQTNVYRDAGFEEFVVIANPANRTMIAELIGNEAAIAVQDEPLGMGHAILQARDFLAERDFPPIYVCQVNDVVDSSLHQSLMDAYKGGNAASYLAGFTVNEYFPGGYLSVEDDGKITGLVEKPGAGDEPSDLVNIVAHVHTETKALIDAIDALYAADHPHDDHYEVAMANLMEDMRYECVRYEGRWHPIKYPWQVLDVNDFYLSQIDGQHIHPDANLYGEVTILGDVIIEAGAKIFPGAAIVGPAYIGTNTVVGNGALVRASHVGPGCVVGHTSEVARSYLEKNVNLHRAVVLDSVFEEYVNFSAGCVTANLRIDGGTIKSTVKGDRIDSGRDKLGAMIGANTFIGIQSGTMPGVKLGANSEIGAFTNVVSDLGEGTRRYAVQTYEERQATGTTGA